MSVLDLFKGKTDQTEGAELDILQRVLGGEIESLTAKIRSELSAEMQPQIEDKARALAAEWLEDDRETLKNDLAQATRERDSEVDAMVDAQVERVRSEFKERYADRLDSATRERDAAIERAERAEAALVDIWQQLLPADGKSRNLRRATGIARLNLTLHRDVLARAGLTLKAAVGYAALPVECVTDAGVKMLERFTLSLVHGHATFCARGARSSQWS